MMWLPWYSKLGYSTCIYALSGMPVTVAIFGFRGELIEALLYNLFANRFVGIDLDIE